jgi:hypothetical protein
MGMVMETKTVDQLIEELSAYKGQGLVVGIREFGSGWTRYEFKLEINPEIEPHTLLLTMPLIN